MSPGEQPEALLRIGEIARRAGIPAPTLRAWERRYGIVEPVRTGSGYRLYSGEDERRLKSMVDLISRGVAPAEAARRVMPGPSEAGRGVSDGANGQPGSELRAEGTEELRGRLLESLLAYDDLGAQRIIDAAIASLSTAAMLVDVILPVMCEIGDRWRAGNASVAAEHFATGVIRSRVLPLARGWGGGRGPLVLLACPPGERHDLGLIAFGLLLRERGWRAVFLGADTPFDAIERAASEMNPAAIALAVVGGDPGPDLDREWIETLRSRAPVFLGGAAASPELAERVGATPLAPGLTDAVEQFNSDPTLAAD